MANEERSNGSAGGRKVVHRSKLVAALRFRSQNEFLHPGYGTRTQLSTRGRAKGEAKTRGAGDVVRKSVKWALKPRSRMQSTKNCPVDNEIRTYSARSH